MTARKPAKHDCPVAGPTVIRGTTPDHVIREALNRTLTQIADRVEDENARRQSQQRSGGQG